MPPALFASASGFADDSERVVWDALVATLREGDVLLQGVRITDLDEGDVEIDLLVLMPEAGAAVIEVKGGLVRYADGAWTQSDRNGTRPIRPTEQAARATRALRRFVERQPTWSRGHLRAGWLLALPYAQVDADLAPTAPREVLLTADDLAHAADRVYARLSERDIAAGVPAAGWVDSAVDLLRDTMDATGGVQARVASRLRHADQLTERQAHILDVARQIRQLEVVGPAGTGKTWLAMEQAQRWTRARERVCLVSYGRGVAELMGRALADSPHAPAFVGTFHQLGHQWGVIPDGDQPQSYWELDAPAAMATAAAKLPDGERFTAFVIDEAQDFADSWWTALLASRASDDPLVAIFRDDQQAVFSQRRGRPEMGLTTLTLDENLRNCQQVVDTFRPLVGSPITPRGGDGFGVEFVDCAADDVMPTADGVVEDLLERRGWLPEHIALLTTCHRHPAHAEQQDRRRYWDDAWAGDQVFYGTVAGFKGLERPAVVLAVDGFHEGVDPRSVLYAGMSRARDLLVVVGPADVIDAASSKLRRRLERGPGRHRLPPAIALPPR